MLGRGFTLIEVMVTLIILMFGLLGIAGLMAKGQRASFEAFQRQQALALATDMAERIRTNRARTGCTPFPCDGLPYYNAAAPLITPLGTGIAYNDYLTGATKDCGVFTCSTGELAAYDVALWDGLLTGYSEVQTATAVRVGGIINALGCVVETANTAGACPPPPTAIQYTRSIQISVAWQGNEDTTIPVASTCGQNLYTAETRRRLVVLNMMVLQPC